MASKKRGGLSKREFAAKQLAKKPVAKPKASVRPTVSSYSDPTLAAEMNPAGATQNPLKGQYAPVSNVNVFANKKSSDNKSGGGSSSKPSNQRSLASKALDLAGAAGAKLRNVPGLKQIAEYGDDYVNTGNKSSLAKVMAPFAVGAAIPAGMFAAGAGAAGSGISSLAGAGRGIIGRGAKNLFRRGGNLADDVTSKLPPSALPIASAVGAGTAGFVPSIGSVIGETQRHDPSSPFPVEPTAETKVIDRPSIDNRYIPNDDFDNRPRGRDNDPSLPDEMGDMSGFPIVPDPVGPADAPIYDTPGPTVPKTYGSGAFGTGKGVMNSNPLYSEYQSQLKGFRKQESAMDKLYEEMLKSLDPTYDEYGNDIKKSVDAELNQNLVKLAAVMNANNTGDSEQRAQMMSGKQNDAQAMLGDLLRKLMLQKQQDAMGIKEKRAGALENLQTRQMSTREKLAQLMDSLQQRSLKGSGGTIEDDYTSGASELQNYLDERRGSDGYVSPQDYQAAQRAFLKDYPKQASKFNSLFPKDNYLSANERKSLSTGDDLLMRLINGGGY